MNTANTFPEERYSAEELLAREEAQRHADDQEELLALFGFSPKVERFILPLEDEPLPF